MDRLIRDLTHALRSFRGSPGVVALAILSLGLGIAVNVAMFAGVYSLLWRPLGYPESDRLVQVWQTNLERGWDRSSMSVPNFLDLRREARTVRLAASARSSFNFAEGERPERVDGIRVSGDYLELIGAPMALGRRLGPVDEAPGGERSVVLSDRFWRSRFEGDSSILRRPVLLDGEPYTVVGVLAPSFRLEGEPVLDLFIPLMADPAARRGDAFLRVIGRLAPGATLASAGAELARMTRTLATNFPAINQGMGARVVPLLEEVVEGPARLAGTITMVAVAFVLLIACANVANLLLARATGRDRELAVRSALGASRGQLVRALLTESLLLAVVGGTLGLGLSFAGVGWLRSIIPADFPRVEHLRLDWVAFGFAAIVSLGSGLVFGIAPAWRSSRPNLVTSLRDGARGMTGLRHGRMLSILVGVEIALALVLLICAGLLIKGSRSVLAVDPGFSTRSALTFRTSLTAREYPDSAAVVRFQTEFLDRLAGLEGVDAVGATSQLPFEGGRGSTYLAEGEPDVDPGKAPIAQVRMITPGYLTAIGLPVVAGRGIERGDRFESPRVVLVSEGVARRHWAGQNPIGRRIRVFQTWWEVAGVVRDSREFGVDDPPPPMLFFSSAQVATRGMTFVLKTALSPARLAQPSRAAIRETAPTQPLYAVRTLAEVIDRSTANARIMPQLLTVFGLMALVMAIVGVYGVMAYAVGQRTRELGVRRALGAPDRSIVAMVIRQSVTVCLLGGVAGLAVAALATRGLGFFLYGVSPFDPAIFGGVTATLLGAAILASAVPARRASRVDPITALRSD